MPLLLDLFCGAGGAAAGYARAGFEVVGVDIEPQPRYPFEFIQADASDTQWFAWALSLGFDAIHASPPCQRYSDLAKRNGNAHEHPDLIPTVRGMLLLSGLPYVIENVEGAPLALPVRLCGTAFPGLRVIRHRLFEANWPIAGTICDDHPLLYVPDKRRPHQGRLNPDFAYVNVTGGGNCSKAQASEAMHIDWMTKDELNEAIPPPYTEYIGWQLRTHMRVDGLTARQKTSVSPNERDA